MTAALPMMSHTRISMWRECQQKHEYRYGQGLVPKRLDRALFMGSWIHAALAAHYEGKDWHTGAQEFLDVYEKQSQTDKYRLSRQPKQQAADEDLEPLSSQVERIMESYLWYNRDERIEVLGVEKRIEMVNDAYRTRLVLDLIYRDSNGRVWIRDHKVTGDIPDEGAFHTMDPQLTIYLEGAREVLGIDASGVEYNYICSKPPGVPALNKDGSISKRAVVTDRPTLVRFLEANGRDVTAYADILDPLTAASPLLRRYRLPRSDVVTRRVLSDFDRSAREIMGSTDPIRNITRNCSRCHFEPVCRAELFGLDSRFLRAQMFTTSDGSPIMQEL